VSALFRAPTLARKNSQCKAPLPGLRRGLPNPIDAFITVFVRPTRKAEPETNQLHEREHVPSATHGAYGATHRLHRRLRGSTGCGN
jgi:hypothetical protein